jgi:hypothetical protein
MFVEHQDFAVCTLDSGKLWVQLLMPSSAWIGYKCLAPCRFIRSTSGFQFRIRASGHSYRGSMQFNPHLSSFMCSLLRPIVLQPWLPHRCIHKSNTWWTPLLLLFEPPSSLPPSRSCNHTIPLLPGAQPVFVRPYRYPPALKDEIKKQVKDMLD